MKARILVKVAAGARKTEFAGCAGDVWKLRVSAPAAGGRANDEILRFLARTAGVPIAAVRIVTGAQSTRKLIEVAGIGSETLTRVILESHGPGPDTGSAAPREA
jgi:uncharacterized protein (TIGR00251 family)